MTENHDTHHDGWSRDIPVEPGYYWFVDPTDSFGYKQNAAPSLVRVKRVHDVLWYISVYSGFSRHYGPKGAWTPAKFPKPPPLECIKCSTPVDNITIVCTECSRATCSSCASQEAVCPRCGSSSVAEVLEWLHLQSDAYEDGGPRHYI